MTAVHENYGRDEHTEGSSDRAFGLTVGGILLAIALVRLAHRWWTGVDLAPTTFDFGLIGVGGILVVLGAVAPSTLYWPNRAWTMLGLFLFKVVNPIVLGLIFGLTIVPIGLLLRLFGKDPLNRAFDTDAKSYWIERTPPGPEPATMNQQF